MKRVDERLLVALCLMCGVVFGVRNVGAAKRHPVPGQLEAPMQVDGLLQRDAMRRTTGASFLCRGACAGVPAWPGESDPGPWLRRLGQTGAQRGVGERPDAPALVRHDGQWIILWGERSDRLEVVLEAQGAGVWPRARFRLLYGSAWWGPLR